MVRGDVAIKTGTSEYVTVRTFRGVNRNIIFDLYLGTSYFAPRILSGSFVGIFALRVAQSKMGVAVLCFACSSHLVVFASAASGSGFIIVYTTCRYV